MMQSGSPTITSDDLLTNLRIQLRRPFFIDVDKYCEFRWKLENITNETIWIMAKLV